MHLFNFALWFIMAVGATCSSDGLTLCTGVTSQNVGFCADADTASTLCISANSFQTEADGLGFCGVFFPLRLLLELIFP
jgi:hypothetical protein